MTKIKKGPGTGKRTQYIYGEGKYGIAMSYTHSSEAIAKVLNKRKLYWPT